MTDDLDGRLRSGLAALAVLGDADGARERVRARVGKRKRKRQRNLVVTSVVGVLVMITAAALVGRQGSGPPSSVAASRVTHPDTTIRDSAAAKTSATSAATASVDTQAAPNRSDDTGPAASAPRAPGSPRRTTPPTVAKTPTSGPTTPPVSVPSGSPTTPQATSPATATVTTPVTQPANTATTNPRTPPPPPTTVPSKFPGATPTHMVVVLEDAGLEASTAVMPAGKVSVTFLDHRTSQPESVLAIVFLDGDASFGVEKGHTETFILTTPKTYQYWPYATTYDPLTLSIVVPAGAGASTDLPGEIGVDITTNRMHFPNRDTIEDVITLPGVPAGVPIVRLQEGSFLLRLNNLESNRVDVTVDAVGFSLQVPRRTVATGTVVLPAGSYLLKATNRQTHVTVTSYLYVEP